MVLRKSLKLLSKILPSSIHTDCETYWVILEVSLTLQAIIQPAVKLILHLGLALARDWKKLKSSAAAGIEAKCCEDLL